MGLELILSCFVLILSYFWFDFVDFVFGLANVEMGYDNAHGLLPKCTIELLFHFACSLHKPKTQLFSKKLRFIPNQTGFLYFLSSEWAFWVENIETNRHLMS